MDFQPRPKQLDLLAEPLSDSEVRTLLERLGSREFGGSENATVGAVVEATGAEARTVGRLLADIRKEDFEERFGLQLSRHEGRIASLEDKTRSLERIRRSTERNSSIYFARVHDPESSVWVKQTAISIGISAIVFLLLLCSGVMCGSS